MNLFAAVLTRVVGAEPVTRLEDATHGQVTPAGLGRLLAHGAPVRGRRLLVAGDRLARAVADRAGSAGAFVDHYYGAAELSFVAWGRDEEDLRPFPEVEVEVRAGVIWVRSPYLCDGYDGRPGPLLRDRDGWASVGDRGRLDGSALRVLGRGVDTVTTAGATVLAGEVEEALRPSLAGAVVVVGVSHPDLGEVVAAVLTEPTDLSRAREAAATSLAPSHRPRRWFHLRELPLTESAKTDRAAVRRHVSSGDATPIG